MIFVALGANLPSSYGSPYETLQAAKKAMQDKGITIAASSRTWLTAPVPVSDQPWYHNEVARVETTLSPYELLEVLQDIENGFGRVRTVRNAPRILDLDLIGYHAEILDKPELIVPHPRMHKRAFVLLPLREVAENWAHPVLGMTLDDLIVNLPSDQEAVPMEEKVPV
ncbi:2-amino-4-hydroxy-6-hydroxymethyldihydropteridine diphosphokinase [Hoeflea sp.]|uniref:2-amino-4-hydroxy-6- hydroxymethyldihydropteridine diphosphokinase n=1 Tax=Hoeflea sp. TaxID=1940281 RepID=UPI0019A4F36F|nr:2-amino-4-hydroxy-6-hydroxymethyldihydropteridine diphosphokinase [Hoeflea sp.]MBC7286236.1 2-amino-4-hydroxy-6-hydroxymethyldihydropteridine diphosphokinase [Hoeflea sp.]